MDDIHKKVIEEIVKLLKDNLEILYRYDDKALLMIKEYCVNNNDEKYKPLKNLDLVRFTEEAIADIINTPYLYDFRPLE